MKSIQCSVRFASLVFLMTSSAVWAQAPQAPAAPQAQPSAAPTQAPQVPPVEELHNGLRRLQATMEKALNSRDLDTIVANVHDDVVFTTMNGDIVRGKQGVREYFERMMNGPDKVVEDVQTKFEADDLSVLHGGDTAVAFGHTQDHYVLTGGETFDVQARWSGTMLRRGKEWIVGSFHYSTNMFDNPVLAAQQKAFTWISVMGALLVAVVAFLLGRRGRA